MNIAVEFRTDNGQTLGLMTASPKDFKTGSKGYYSQGKLEIEGKRYQVQVQLVEIGSKERAKSEA
ncbi:MAG TPA: hypothetical protein VJG32_02425 [Anaerolineae bacterium]|nr:hypothetical protein [Anaerolineae bacterium]